MTGHDLSTGDISSLLALGYTINSTIVLGVALILLYKFEDLEYDHPRPNH